MGVTPNPYSQVAESVLHHCVLDVNDAMVQFRALRTDSSQIDSVVLLGSQEVHDVAVTAVDAPASVSQGNTAVIDVHVANEGNRQETFNVVLTDTTDSETIGTQPVTLSPGQSTVVTFNWQTDQTTSVGDVYAKYPIAFSSSAADIEITRPGPKEKAVLRYAGEQSGQASQVCAFSLLPAAERRR